MKQSVIAQLRYDVQIAEKHRSIAKCILFCWNQRKKTAKWKRDLSAMHASLIEYYGVTNGKREWASVIRKVRMKGIHLNRRYKHCAEAVKRAKGALSVAREFAS